MNKNLPPLPLIDGCLFVDNSGFMEGTMSCYRLVEYKALRKRILAAEKPALNFGSAIHLALEYRYKTYQNRSVDDAYYNTIAGMLTQFFDDHEVPSDDWRTLNWCMKLIRKYNEKYDIEQFNLLADAENKPLVELSFSLRLFDWIGWLHIDSLGADFPPDRIREHGKDGMVKVCITIIYTGRIDLPISMDDSIYINDFKTTSMLGSMFWDQQRRSSQQRGYVWAFEQTTGLRVAGYQITAIRTKEPPIYVQTNSGKGKQSPEQWWNETFQRERFFMKPGDTEEWKRNTITLVNEFFWHYQNDYMPMKTTWCAHYGKCAYYDVCQLDVNDRNFMLASGIYTDNTWSPLKQLTQSKQ